MKMILHRQAPKSFLLHSLSKITIVVCKKENIGENSTEGKKKVKVKHIQGIRDIEK